MYRYTRPNKAVISGVYRYTNSWPASLRNDKKRCPDSQAAPKPDWIWRQFSCKFTFDAAGRSTDVADPWHGRRWSADLRPGRHRSDLRKQSNRRQQLSHRRGSGNRLGFIGTETLSKDLWAFYRLETSLPSRRRHRTQRKTRGTQFWTDKAWVGIGSKTHGALSAGRILTVGNSIVGGGDTEAMTDSIGATNSRKASRIENNLDNGLFYESPGSSPQGHEAARQGPLCVGRGRRHPESLRPGRAMALRFLLDTGYQHDCVQGWLGPSKEDRKSNSWFTGAGYDFDSFELKITFATSRGYEGDVSDHSPTA